MITLSPDRDKGRKPRATAPSAIHAWKDFVRLYPIYRALAQQCELSAGPYSAAAAPVPWPNKETRDRDLLWMDEIDGELQAVDLRQFLATPAATREDGLRIFLQRHLLKPTKLPSDRDKIDLLIVQYFVLCAPQDLIAASVEFADVARILKPVVGEVEAASLPCCEPLDRILELGQQCHRLRDLLEGGLLDQGRIAKEAAGEMFYDPAALVSICRFNFVLRRIFIQLLHQDLRAIGQALNELERKGLKSVDCRNSGLSAEESVAKLRQFHQHWKAPFQSDYSQGSSFRPYEQLMSLREDLDEALGSKPAEGARPSAKPASADASKRTKTSPDPVAGTPPSPVQPAASSVSKESGSASGQKSPGIGVADVETLEEKIWEQLIATPPVRGRSMTTVTVEETRVLLSAWEVAAFISASGQDSDELRRVIVARALLSTAMERRKRFLDFKNLHQAVAHARGEIPRFQERIDQLKRSMKTDSAVNLGISLKRLLSIVEEAEQLQKGKDSKEEKP